MILLILVLSIFSALPPFRAVGADSPSSRGAALMNACAACHGPDGHSQGAIPSMENLLPEHVVTALRAFRAGDRHGTVMNRIAKGLDDTDLEALATYLTAVRKQ